MTRTGSNYELKCKACEDTGLNSKGGLCHPCLAHNRQTLRDAVLRAVKACFDNLWDQGMIPGCADVEAVVRWAFEPRVTYAAGFRDRHGDDMRMFAGPVQTLGGLAVAKPPVDPYSRTAYIVRLVRGTTPDEISLVEPIARWHDGQWQPKKGVYLPTLQTPTQKDDEPECDIPF